MSKGFLVSPRKTLEIRAAAHRLLDGLGITTPEVPILRIIETILPMVDEDYSFAIMDTSELRARYGYDAEGITDHPEKMIALRADVYDGASNGNGRDRFTAAHELGHYLLHKNEGLAFMRATTPDTPIYRSSEWQADTYARELLVDIRKIDPRGSQSEIAAAFGVSHSVAGYQLEKAKKLALCKGLIR